MSVQSSPTDLTTLCVDPNYWYPVARERDVAVAKPLQVRIAGLVVVLFRTGANNEVAALEDRCCHRKVFLSRGIACDDGITCPFHGWRYSSTGHLRAIPSWPAGRPLPQARVRRFPVRTASGLIWLFLGDQNPRKDEEFFRRTLFDPSEWFRINLDRTFQNHFAFGVINGMDFTHFYLHRKYQPWKDIRVEDVQVTADSVTGKYRIIMSKSRAAVWLQRLLRMEAGSLESRTIEVEFLYPHHFARMDDELRVAAYFCPISRDRCRVFIDMFVRKSSKIPLLQRLWLMVMKEMIFSRIQGEDAWIGEREQEANDAFPEHTRCEVNPISIAVERLLTMKSDAYRAAAQPSSLSTLGREAERRAQGGN